jgi:hypothetical protein
MLTANSVDASTPIDGSTAGRDLARWIRMAGNGLLRHPHDCLMYHVMRG